jgi:hypothetical protein
MRPLEVLPKAGLCVLLMQFAFVSMAFLIREHESEQGARLILVSWLPGLVAFVSGIVATFTTRRFKWLGLSLAAFLVWCASVLFFVGIGL